MLRDGAVELDQVETGLHISPDHVADIHTMLAGDPRTAQIGLEMAAHCDGDISRDQMVAALTKLSSAQARTILDRFAGSPIPARRILIQEIAKDGPSQARALAWEHVFANGESTAAEARGLLDDPEESVRCVAAAAILVDDPADEPARAVLRGPLSSGAAICAVEVLRHTVGQDLATVLQAIGMHADPAVRAAALAAAENSSANGSGGLLAWAEQAVSDPEPAVRKEALTLLARVAPATKLIEIAETSFGDPSPEVRHAGAKALAARGSTAVPAICEQLRGDREETQLAAIEALAVAIGPAAGDRLFEELHAHVFAPLSFSRQLMRSYPTDSPNASAMQAALDNSTRKAVRIVLHTLDALGHHRTLKLVRTMMRSRDERNRANAVGQCG